MESNGEGNGNPLQYSCLENSMDRGAWRATVHGVTKCWTQLSVHAHTHTQNAWHTLLFQEIIGQLLFQEILVSVTYYI